MNPQAIFNELHTLYDHQGWWPLTLTKIPTKARFPVLRVENGVTYGIPWKKLSAFKTRNYDPFFDIATGAILTQNTAWRNVAQALLNLAHHHLLTASAIARANPRTIEKYIRPSGYFKQKTRKLKLFAEYIRELAEEFGIPTVRNIPLAWSLIELEIGDEIPETLYIAVAELLTFVYRLKEEKGPKGSQ